jgi:zinc/manganese transport system substrate-binding protein
MLSVLLFLISLLSGCSMTGTQRSTASAKTSATLLHVVAGENFWGSIAAQLGGSYVAVSSIVSSPTGDPHDYESTANDARAIALADYVILNGAGYDDWGTKLLDANPSEGRKVLNIADLVGKKAGDNPHLWYNPTFVEQAAQQITADYKALDPSSASYFDQQHTTFEKALTPYRAMIASIKQTYAGADVGISESIFIYMADALGLHVLTPAAYYTAEANGTEPPADSVAIFNQQLETKQIKVFILNVQTIDNTVRNLQQEVATQHIPVVEISETVRPANGSFEDWQLAQLTALRNALFREAEYHVDHVSQGLPDHPYPEI